MKEHLETMPDMKSSALVLIDMQKGFNDPSWGRRNNHGAEKQARLLLEYFRSCGYHVIHIQHLSTEVCSPLFPGQIGVEFMDEVSPVYGERIFQKSVNSAFIGTCLESYLREAGIRNLFLAGFTSDHCVSTTARMAGNLGFKVRIISDATVAFDRSDSGQTYSADLVHGVSLASLQGEFADIIGSSSVLAYGQHGTLSCDL
jgi:nicotinamidase-related amidase